MSGLTWLLLVVPLLYLLLRLGYRRRFFKYALPILRRLKEGSGRLSSVCAAAFPNWADAAGARFVAAAFKPRVRQLAMLELAVTGFGPDPVLSITALGREVLHLVDSGTPSGRVWRHIQASIRRKRQP